MQIFRLMKGFSISPNSDCVILNYTFNKVNFKTVLLLDEKMNNIILFPGLMIGSSISKRFAAFLEENDLFVPDDDDVD